MRISVRTGFWWGLPTHGVCIAGPNEFIDISMSKGSLVSMNPWTQRLVVSLVATMKVTQSALTFSSNTVWMYFVDSFDGLGLTKVHCVVLGVAKVSKDVIMVESKKRGGKGKEEGRGGKGKKLSWIVMRDGDSEVMFSRLCQ